MFITGTDTGVGKTLVTAALAQCLKHRQISVGVMKPVETGYVAHNADQSDAGRLSKAAGMTEPLARVCPYRFPMPLAPLAAARLAGSTISLARIVTAFRRLSARHTLMLVEGAGGIRVPISAHADIIDLIKRLKLPVVVVGRAALGGVNHMLLTIETLRRHHISLAAVVLNQTAPVGRKPIPRLQVTSTVALLKERICAPVIGPLPYQPLVQQSWEPGLATVARSAAISELADVVLATALRTRAPLRSHRPLA
jgi:dethiobiotin synthetase